eukprot:TRINITY_DN24693_c0_g1_i3.p1 TRINITY_DN24693_c0_g1~~TRINITY_DN24693_c0_g1_i3.p1  ORF type:complete len:331 (+),score=71.21 TRINITY_DN24693_c0_g1_i3:188-1180(+)
MCIRDSAYSGHFGSYLLDQVDHPLVFEIVRTMSAGLDIPVFCKIRLLDTQDATIEFCKGLQKSGCKLITIHARYRGSPDRRRDGPAYLDQIPAIKASLTIPVVANGNMTPGMTPEDFHNNLLLSQADGIMSAEGILDNPAVFCDSQPACRPNLALEYLELHRQYPSRAGLSTVIFHCRRICKQELNRYQLMEEMRSAESAARVKEIVQQCVQYELHGGFVWSDEKRKASEEKAKRTKLAASSRARFEARMKRKAAREGKDAGFYLKTGPPPSPAAVCELLKIDKAERVGAWRTQGFGQHCMEYHLSECGRMKDCAFLHTDFGGVEPDQMG